MNAQSQLITMLEKLQNTDSEICRSIIALGKQAQIEAQSATPIGLLITKLVTDSKNMSDSVWSDVPMTERQAAFLMLNTLQEILTP